MNIRKLSIRVNGGKTILKDLSDTSIQTKKPLNKGIIELDFNRSFEKTRKILNKKNLANGDKQNIENFKKQLINKVTNDTKEEVVGFLQKIKSNAEENKYNNSVKVKFLTMTVLGIMGVTAVFGGIQQTSNTNYDLFSEGQTNKESVAYTHEQPNNYSDIIKNADKTDSTILGDNDTKLEVLSTIAQISEKDDVKIKTAEVKTEVNILKEEIKNTANNNTLTRDGYDVLFGNKAQNILATDAYKEPMPWSGANGVSMYQRQEIWAKNRANVVLKEFTNEEGKLNIPLTEKQKEISNQVSPLLIKNFKNKVKEKLNYEAKAQQISDYQDVINIIIWYAESKGEDPYKWLAILSQESGWGVLHIKHNYFGYGKTDSQDLGYHFDNKQQGAIGMMEIISNTKYWGMDIKTMTNKGNWNFTDKAWYGSVSNIMWQLKQLSTNI